MKNRFKEKSYTAVINYGGKKQKDVTLFKDEKKIGHLQFLHCNRSDVQKPDKRFIHIVFYIDSLWLEEVKKIVIQFFSEFSLPIRGVAEKIVDKKTYQERFKKEERPISSFYSLKSENKTINQNKTKRQLNQTKRQSNQTKRQSNQTKRRSKNRLHPLNKTKRVY